MRAMVTGAAGFIGSHLVERLLRQGDTVVAVDNLTDYYDVDQKRANLAGYESDAGVDVVLEDLADASVLDRVGGVDVVFHLAGQPGVRLSWDRNFVTYVERNIDRTQQLLEAARAAGLPRLVYASSSSVYGNQPSYPVDEEAVPHPFSPYGVTKLAAEHMCSLYAQNYGVHNRRLFRFGASSLAAVALLAAPAGVAADQDGSHDVTSHKVTSFDGLNHYWDRTLNPASIDPPEQGLCVGNGYVVESVASAIAIYDTHGNVLQAPKALNDFYAYLPVTQLGPRLNDPSCYFDVATQRWFHTVLAVDFTLLGTHVVPTGGNHVDIAVSKSADPTGAWSFFKLLAQNDCAAGGPPWANPHACLGDFPRIGADAHGFYVTTNDYSYFTQVFRSASVYAFSKRALETDTANAAYKRFDTAGLVSGDESGFTLEPAQSSSSESFRSGDLDTARGGTEFFLSSNAADEVNAAHSHASRDLIVWALTNTASLDSDAPSLHFTNTVVKVDQYSVPPRAQQMAGPTPLATCLNDTTLQLGPTTFGCWRILHLPSEPSHTWSEAEAIDTGDTRMQQVVFAGGMLYGSLGTAVTVDGSTMAGVAWFAVRPHVAAQGAVHAQVVAQGDVTKTGASLIAPAIAVNDDGTGAIAFSLMGPNDYPSAAYVPFDVKRGTGKVQLAARGAGPDDSLTDYAAAFGLTDLRARWGDYGAAVSDGSRIWMASEYIGQACTFPQWLASGLTCGGTRMGAGNWYTRITAVTVER